MSDFIPGSEPTTLPFSQAVLEAEAKNAAEHPENHETPWSQSEAGKLLMETEQRDVADFQAGKITQEEFNHLHDVSQAQLDSLREHVGEDLHDLAEKVDDWKHDTVDTFNDLKASHPEVMADLAQDNPTLLHATMAADIALDRIEPLIVDVAFEGVHHLGDHLIDDVKDSVVTIVEARSDLPSVSDAEHDSNSARLEVATAKMDQDKEQFDRAIDEAEVKVHQDFNQAHQAIEVAHDYAEAHPEAHVFDHGPMSDTPDAQQELAGHDGAA